MSAEECLMEAIRIYDAFVTIAEWGDSTYSVNDSRSTVVSHVRLSFSGLKLFASVA